MRADRMGERTAIRPCANSNYRMLLTLTTFLAAAVIGGILSVTVQLPGERRARRERDCADAYCVMRDGIRRSRNADIG